MKEYVKPELFYESFVLSQHIATCAWDLTNLKSITECYAVNDSVPGVFAFSTGVAVCKDGPIDGICYTNGAAGVNLFNS